MSAINDSEKDAQQAAKVAAVKARKQAANVPNLLKELKVKISVVKRMDKEVKYYHKEATENEAILQRLKDEGKDEYEWKQQVKIYIQSNLIFSCNI